MVLKRCNAPCNPPCPKWSVTKKGLCMSHNSRFIRGASISTPIGAKGVSIFDKSGKKNWMTPDFEEALSLSRAGLLPEVRPLSGLEPPKYTEEERQRAERIDSEDDVLGSYYEVPLFEG